MRSWMTGISCTGMARGACRIRQRSRRRVRHRAPRLCWRIAWRRYRRRRVRSSVSSACSAMGSNWKLRSLPASATRRSCSTRSTRRLRRRSFARTAPSPAPRSRSRIARSLSPPVRRSMRCAFDAFTNGLRAGSSRCGRWRCSRSPSISIVRGWRIGRSSTRCSRRRVRRACRRTRTRRRRMSGLAST